MRKLLVPLGLGIAALLGAMLLAVSPGFADGLPTRTVAKAQADPLAELPIAPQKWTGVYVSGFAGYGSADAALSAGGLGIDGFAATGQLGGVDVGARFQVPHTYLVPGARVGYTWSRETFEVTPGLLSVHIDNGWHADAILGAAMGTAMPYIGFGRSVMQTSTSVAGFSSPDLKGWRYIAGVEFRAPKMDLGFVTPTYGLEVVYTDNDSVNIGGPVNLHVTDLAAMARLNLQFWK